jgi:hypothetical protein
MLLLLHMLVTCFMMLLLLLLGTCFVLLACSLSPALAAHPAGMLLPPDSPPSEVGLPTFV